MPIRTSSSIQYDWHGGVTAIARDRGCPAKGGKAMAIRQTMGISLAFLMFSSGAIAKPAEKSFLHHPDQSHGKSVKAEMRHSKARFSSCKAVHTPAHAHRSRRMQSDSADADSVNFPEGRADAYVGPVHPIGTSEIGTAAWYNWVGARTSSGEILDRVTATAAHRSLPLASYAKVTNLDNGHSLIVKINDRGPWRRRFIIDLSPRAADELGVRRSGVAAVMVEPVAPGAPPPNAAPPTF
jgi:rare lipoprotein A (peptidoglycan hydrolase)